MTARILSRSHWTSTSARGTPFNWSRVRGIVTHYPAMGGDVGVLTQAEEEQLIRAWRNYHVNVLGWSDLGYNWIIAQSGRIYTGRGARVAAHSVGHNSTTAGVLFIAGNDEALTPAAEASFRALRVSLRRKGCGSGVWGHREMSGNSTRCPGPKIMGSIRAGRLTSGSTGVTTPRPGDAARPWRSSPRVAGMAEADVRGIQATLADLDYDLGSWGVDGSYGDATGTAVQQLQHDLNITADGVYGPGTEKALMSKLDEIEKKVDRAIAIGTVNQRRIGRIPAEVLDEPVELVGAWEGQTSTLRRMRSWYAEDLRQIKEGVATSRAAVLEAVQETGKAQGLTDDQVQAVADAAAEAAAKVSAEDVAEKLEVAVAERG